MEGGDPLPSTAVQGGYTLDGDPLYVIMVETGQDTPGYYDPKKGYAEYELTGVRTTNNFDILTFERRKYSIFTQPPISVILHASII